MKTALLALLVFVNLSIAEGLRIRVNERSRGGRAYGSAQLSVGESFQYGGGAYGRPLVYFVYVQQPTPQFFAQPELTLPYGYGYGGGPTIQNFNGGGCNGGGFQSMPYAPQTYGGGFAPQGYGVSYGGR
jgi:hypothetical protein